MVAAFATSVHEAQLRGRRCSPLVLIPCGFHTARKPTGYIATCATSHATCVSKSTLKREYRYGVHRQGIISAGAWRVGSVGPCAERWAAGGAVRNQSRNGIARTVVHQAPPATKQRRKPHLAAAVCGARSVSWVLLLPLVQSARRARPTPLLIRATTPTSAQSQATPGRKMADGRASAMDLAAAAVLAAINSRRADAT
jgi:hypothetical protein